MTALAELAPLGHETIDDDHSHLKALLNNDFLIGAGWDWQTMVLSPPADHPTLGWLVCQVRGCEGMVEGGKGVCAACALRTARSGSDELPDLCEKTYTVGVGLCAVGCARPWESRRRLLCAAHQHQQGTASTEESHLIYESRLELARLLVGSQFRLQNPNLDYPGQVILIRLMVEMLEPFDGRVFDLFVMRNMGV